MRYLAIVRATVLLLFVSPVVWADTVTTGDLQFKCPGCPLEPTGSFVFDNTTEQFLSFNATWDAIHFTFSFVTDISQQGFYNELITPNSGLQFDFTCSGATLAYGPCNSIFEAVFFAPGGDLYLKTDFSTFNPAENNVSSAGEVRATHLEDPVIATPEPASWSLVLGGAAAIAFFAIIIGKLLKARREYLGIQERATPVIMTKYGAVSEPARKRAALNMREDAELMERVTNLVAQELTPAETQHATQLCAIIAPIIDKGVTLSDDGMLDLLQQVLAFLQRYVDASMVDVNVGASAEMRRRYPEAFGD